MKPIIITALVTGLITLPAAWYTRKLVFYKAMFGNVEKAIPMNAGDVE